MERDKFVSSPLIGLGVMAKKPKQVREQKSSETKRTETVAAPDKEQSDTRGQAEQQTNPDLLSAKALLLIDAFEAELQQGHVAEWMPVMERLESIFGKYAGEISGSRQQASTELPKSEVDDTYEQLQSKLIKIRDATAHAIATEKQLEQQLQKNKDQAATWQDREAMALKQRNPELAEQANQRSIQYVQAAGDLHEQLTEQKQTTQELRRRLTEFENIVQRAYTRKQTLIARHTVAEALLAASDILREIDEGVSTFDKYETLVENCEAKAASSGILGQANTGASSYSLTDFAVVLEGTIEAMQKLQRIIETQSVRSSNSETDVEEKAAE